MPQARAFEQAMALAKETTWGTGVAPTITMPITGGGVTTNIEEIYDEGRRGVAAMDFAAYQGSGQSDISIEGSVYPDAIGHILMGLFGTDTKTGAGDPWSHAFSMNATPPSYTIESQVQIGTNGAIRAAGCKFGSLGLTWDAGSGLLAFSAQAIGKIGTKVTAVAPAAANHVPWAGWRSTLVSTNLSARMTSAELNFTRELQAVHTGEGTQNPSGINQGPLRVEGSLTLVVNDLTDFDRYLTDMTQALVVSFTQGTPTRSLTITCTQANFNREPLEYDFGAVGTAVRLQFRALYNATDVGPAAVILVNGLTAAY